MFQEIKDQQPEQEQGGQVKAKEVSYSWYFKLALLECNVFQEIKLEPEREKGGQVRKEVSLSKQSNYLNCL